VEPGNEGKKHHVIIEWGNYRWEGNVEPLNGGKSMILNYQKREKDSIPRITKVMPSPYIDYKDGVQVISTATKISNGAGNTGQDGRDINMDGKRYCLDLI